ncbi:MAG: PaaI family thioesterase [Chloroflexota bacterium]
MTDETRLDALRQRFDASTYATLLGMHVTAIAPGYARVELRLRPEFANFAGLTHGGLLMSLADHAFGCALNTLDRVYVAVQFNIHFLGRPDPGALLVAEGKVMHAGRTAGTGEMTIRDESGRLIASATGAVVALTPRI